MSGKKAFPSIVQASCCFPREGFVVASLAFYFGEAGKVNSGIKV